MFNKWNLLKTPWNSSDSPVPCGGFHPPPDHVRVQKEDQLVFGGPVWPQSVPLLPVFCASMFVAVEVFSLLSGCCVNAETHSLMLVRNGKYLANFPGWLGSWMFVCVCWPCEDQLVYKYHQSCFVQFLRTVNWLKMAALMSLMLSDSPWVKNPDSAALAGSSWYSGPKCCRQMGHTGSSTGPWNGQTYQFNNLLPEMNAVLTLWSSSNQNVSMLPCRSKDPHSKQLPLFNNHLRPQGREKLLSFLSTSQEF